MMIVFVLDMVPNAHSCQAKTSSSHIEYICCAQISTFLLNSPLTHHISPSFRLNSSYVHSTPSLPHPNKSHASLFHILALSSCASEFSNEIFVPFLQETDNADGGCMAEVSEFDFFSGEREGGFDGITFVKAGRESGFRLEG